MIKAHKFKFSRFFKKLLPQSFLGRSFLIILAPVVMIQLLSGYVFFDRHWDYVTRILARDIAGEVSVLVMLTERAISQEDVDALQVTAQKLAFGISFTSNAWETLPESKGAFQSFLKKALRQKLSPLSFKLQLNDDWILIWIQTSKGVLQAKTYTKRLFSRTTPLFVMWSLGSSVVFVLLALLFMKNQIRPLRRLALFAGQLGRGKAHEKFKIQGASEIRKLAWTFRMMSLRLQKQVQERTQMLAEISHDLRTPLTRMKLQLALMEPSVDLAGLQQDVDQMVHLVESYLDFSKEQEREASESLQLASFFRELLGKLPPHSKAITLEIPESLMLFAQPQGIARCFMNLLENAVHYANVQIRVSAQQEQKTILIWVDDDGPGIPEPYYQEVFRPFFRVDASRNAQTGGIGLGLSIVQTILKAHQGTICLMESPLGGLRVQIKLPLRGDLG